MRDYIVSGHSYARQEDEIEIAKRADGVGLLRQWAAVPVGGALELEF
jgi:hypothetical protein